MSAAVPAADGSDPAVDPAPAPDPQVEWLLRLGDTALVAGQRLGSWIGHAPVLEEDLALGNLALDQIGQARAWLTLAGEREGQGRDEDALAYFRAPEAFRNVALAEQPDTDFAHTVVRQWLLGHWQFRLYTAAASGRDAAIAAAAARAADETRYHLRWADAWIERLLDGTAESRARGTAALAWQWRFTAELFAADAVDAAMHARGVGPDLAALQPGWLAAIAGPLQQAGVAVPPPSTHRWFGKQGRHGEAFGVMLAEMQSLARAHPGARW